MATLDASAITTGTTPAADIPSPSVDEARLNDRVRAICDNPGSPPRASRASSSDRSDLHAGPGHTPSTASTDEPDQDHHHHHHHHHHYHVYNHRDHASSSSTAPATPAPSCATCRRRDSKLPTGLIACVRCKQALYCSLDCQESDSAQHLPKCIAPERARPVYQEYIDAYRLRVEDEYVFAGIATGVHNSSHQHPLKGFIRFLDHAEDRGVVPRWWSADARRQCERQAWFGEGVQHPLDKINVIEKYQDPLKPMELRILAERVYGWPIPGFTYTGAEI